MGDKPQIHSNLIFEFESGFVLLLLLLFLVSFVCLFVFKGKEAGINHCFSDIS